jgi:hypothetical protein
LFDQIGANKSIGMGKFRFLIPDSSIVVDGEARALNELIGLVEQLQHYDNACKEAS